MTLSSRILEQSIGSNQTPLRSALSAKSAVILGHFNRLKCYAFCNSYFAICNRLRVRLQIAKQELQSAN
jgi:hypothetical protein